MARKICQQQFKTNPLRRKFPPNRWDLAGSFFERTNPHDFFSINWRKATTLYRVVLKNLNICYWHLKTKSVKPYTRPISQSLKQWKTRHSFTGQQSLSAVESFHLFKFDYIPASGTVNPGNSFMRLAAAWWMGLYCSFALRIALLMCAGTTLHPTLGWDRTHQHLMLLLLALPTSERQTRTYTDPAESNTHGLSFPDNNNNKKGLAHVLCLLLLFQARIHRTTCSFTRKLPLYCQTAFQLWRKYLFQGSMIKQASALSGWGQ